ncbi:DUF6734 family protein [Flavobacterium sharifuzzamanii]|uniref:DUF6734 family protein n=1 Tax=Flavobacterium sharifuzzamanii TaxID=2211133 RepID=UPI000DAD6D96|nr:DUF6734 family protein [Flavobacterium sharifuzzamanii]KAF2082813.1 hypothetical protein DMA14_01395 [Flavobacterium sharifuzzamanii]
MKIIQSFWSGNLTDLTRNYGWSSYKYNWLSWILSCHQLVKFHEEVELYTDRFGYEILIEKLNLPYTKVHVVLDDLNNYPKDLWAVSKIKVYQMLNEPFLHVDGDVFVWESLETKFQNAAVLTQNLEITADNYTKMWDKISPELLYMPVEMEKYHKTPNNFACNMGVVGGNDIDFFKQYSKISIDFLDKNIAISPKINCHNFNLFFEQILFYQYAQNRGVKLEFLFDEVYNDGYYDGFAEFQDVPEKKYLHLLGEYKRNPAVCKAMEIYVMRNYPECYSKMATLINEAEGNQNEIEFLNKEKVEELISDFDYELRNKKFLDDNYLLRRDLYTEALPNYFRSLLDKEDFNIVLLKGFDVVIGQDEEEASFLEIKELNEVSKKYELDNLDEIALSEIEQGIRYSDFISEMLLHFDYDSEEAKKDILILLNSKLTNYIVLKIIAIYR